VTLTCLPLTCLRLAALALLLACAAEDPRLLTPASTFATYRDALTAGDAETSWACLSEGHRRLVYDDDLHRWRDHLATEGRALARAGRRLEISAEREINERLAFLQFDETTVSPGQTPFYYYVREPEGWKITTHLDSLFRRELEAAIETGQFRLPQSGR
jgi:hypothetical protein